MLYIVFNFQKAFAAYFAQQGYRPSNGEFSPEDNYSIIPKRLSSFISISCKPV